MWVALDADTRQVVAMVAGERSTATTGDLWDALPEEYHAGAVVCTDFRAQYRAVVPEDRHAMAGMEQGLTNHLMRQSRSDVHFKYPQSYNSTRNRPATAWHVGSAVVRVRRTNSAHCVTGAICGKIA